MPPSFSISRYSVEGTRDRDFADLGTAVAFAGVRAGVIADLALAMDSKALVVANVDGKAPVVARFLLADVGKPDADADGVGDRRDRCRLGHASEAKSGCRRVARELEIRRFETGIVLSIDSPAGSCIGSRQVRLFEKRPGADRLVRADRPRGYATAKLYYRPLDTGSYYAIVRGGDFTHLARCSAGRRAPPLACSRSRARRTASSPPAAHTHR